MVWRTLRELEQKYSFDFERNARRRPGSYSPYDHNQRLFSWQNLKLMLFAALPLVGFCALCRILCTMWSSEEQPGRLKASQEMGPDYSNYESVIEYNEKIRKRRKEEKKERKRKEKLQKADIDVVQK